MYKRDIIRLPLGKYELTNGIYDYTLNKNLTEDNEPFYRMRIKGSPWYSDSVCFFEDTIQYDDEFFTRTTLRSLSGIKGFSIHSDYNDFFSALSNLTFIPRGSFKEFVKRTS